MTPGARASAAIEVLEDVAGRKRPAAEALKDWGLAHRFAGSSDRAAIGNLVFDALRHRASSAYAMEEDSPRALVLRTLVSSWGMTPDAVATPADVSRFAPAPPMALGRWLVSVLLTVVCTGAGLVVVGLVVAGAP